MNALATKNVATAVERYRALFDAHFRDENALTALRRAALERFIDAGFPTQRDEDWKYTNLRRLESRSFSMAEAAPVAPDQNRWIATAGARIVLVNGRAVATLGAAYAQPPGVTVLGLGQWAINNPDEVAEFLARRTDFSKSAFHALNTAFFEDGVVVDVADQVVLDQPVYVVHLWTNVATQAMSHPKIFLRAGRNSQITLVEHYLSDGYAESFTNTAVSLDLQPGARVAHYRLQQESTRGFHIGNVEARLDSDSRYLCHDIALGAAVARTNITATLLGTGAEAQLRGLFAPKAAQHIDTYTLVDHVAAHTVSNEEYRGIAADRGRGVYRGKVIVRKDAQKIDSRQSSRNLLLSPTAEIDTRPELEIYANDVKCSHGATTGQLDSTALFYLRSRGLSESEARALLIRAFAESILSSVEPQSVREYLERRLNERFANAEE
ncbi:MAG: Fe-S cluster assembly protein SufD [Povalibacter sp.]